MILYSTMKCLVVGGKLVCSGQDYTYLPSGFGEVLFELCGNGSVDVLAAGCVTRYPIKY